MERKKIRKKSHDAEKTEREDSLGFFNIHFVAKLEKIKGGPFDGKKSKKKSHHAEKTESGPLVSLAVCMLRGKKLFGSGPTGAI